MKLLKQTNQIFKKHFFHLISLQLLLFFSSLFFLVYVKQKIQSYIIQIQEYQPLLNSILTNLESLDPAAITQSQAVLNTLSNITNQTMLFAYFIVPLVLLIIWIFCQGFFWKIMKSKKIKNLKAYFTKFSIPTLLIMAVTVLYTSKKQKTIEYFATQNIDITKIFIAVFIALYFLTVFYAVLTNQKFKQAIKTTLKLSIIKFYKYIPLYLPLFINSLILIFLLAITLTQKVTSGFIYVELAPLIIFIVISLTFSTYYKILFQKIIEKDI